ncbi:ArsR/SmtB family transcription factor [Kineococcus sp. SYSU DK006]|uniref:ArsR/SmtB family transcription factor n=1 Tax=Kineococcus sp. SYSU DK006 TaxID=3383127 RepID=UPI003D7DDA3D
MDEVAVIEDAAAAEASLDPVRAALLAALRTPGTASSVAPAVGLTRQKANYHLRTLERHGLVRLVEERRKGNVVERVVQASAASYVISPAALPAVAPDPARSREESSARWLLALGAKLVQDVGTLIAGAARARRPLATYALDAELVFASAADRSRFAAELSRTVADLVARHHAEPVPGGPAGRRHRLVVALHPALKDPAPEHHPALHPDPRPEELP